MRSDNSFSFVRDFERLLGEDLVKKVKSVSLMNPGLWIRLHPNVRSLILPNVLA